MRKRILLVSILITVLALVLFSLACAGTYYFQALEAEKTHLRRYAGVYEEGVTPLDEGGAKTLSNQLGGVRVTFLTLDGKVIADSEAGIESIQIDHAGREEVKKALLEGEGYAVRASKTVGRDLVYYCKKYDGCLVRIGSNVSSVGAVIVQGIPTLAGFLVLDVLACLLATFLASGYILKPVQSLTLSAQKGNKLETEYEELRPIAKVLNERNLKIEQDFAKMAEEKELLEQTKASKDEMIANITHEMNTPLTSIKGFAELLAGEGLTAEQRKRAVEIINTQSERLSNLIAQILHYSELDNDALPSYDVDFTTLVKEALKVFEVSMQEKHITLHSDIMEGVTVFTRQERLMAIVNNLMGNAVRYNKEGGEIFFTLTKQGEFAKLIVKDTGMGIASENLDKIFSRFFTVDKSHNGQGGGFGLGLAYVKKICKKSGWIIGVESTLGEGTTFTVVF